MFNNMFDNLSISLPDLGPKLSSVFNNIINSKMFQNIEFKNMFSGIIPDVKSMLLTAFEQLSESIVNLSNDIKSGYKPIVKTQNDKEKYDVFTNSINQKQEPVKRKTNNIFQNNETIEIGKIIEQASSNECKYLEALVNIGNLTLKEMKKMNGSVGGMSVIPQAPTLINSSSKSKIPLVDNRIGYADSVYTFG